MTPFPVKIFPNIELPKVPKNIKTNPPSCLFISHFTVSLTHQLIHLNFLVIF